MVTTHQGKLRYYRNRNFGNGQRRWTELELERLRDINITDTELAKELARSVQSIQIRRCRLRKVYKSIPSKATPKNPPRQK